MPPRGIPASFHRGGTSRGLLFRADVLAPFSPSLREHIIRTALGSPDPAGRQISGLGGGVSSLSKCAIIGVPGEGKEAQEVYGALPGVSWADKGELEGQAYDVVYRFAQVGVRNSGLDWCAHLLLARCSALMMLLPSQDRNLRQHAFSRSSCGALYAYYPLQHHLHPRAKPPATTSGLSPPVESTAALAEIYKPSDYVVCSPDSLSRFSARPTVFSCGLGCRWIRIHFKCGYRHRGKDVPLLGCQEKRWGSKSRCQSRSWKAWRVAW